MAINQTCADGDIVASYKGAVYHYNPTEQMALVWDKAQKAPMLYNVENEWVEVDAGLINRDLIENWIKERLRDCYAALHELKIGDYVTTDLISLRVKAGYLYKILPSKIKYPEHKKDYYFVDYEKGKICHELVMYNDKLCVFKNPLNFQMYFKNQIKFHSNDELEAIIIQGLTEFRFDPIGYIKEHKHLNTVKIWLNT